MICYLQVSNVSHDFHGYIYLQRNICSEWRSMDYRQPLLKQVSDLVNDSEDINKINHLSYLE